MDGMYRIKSTDTFLVRAFASPANPSGYRGLVYIVPEDHLQDAPRECYGRVEGRARVEPLVEVQEMVLRELEPSLHQVRYNSYAGLCLRVPLFPLESF